MISTPVKRSVVFPDTVQNEARLAWRNVGSQPWTPTTKIGLGLMALFVGGVGTSFVVATIQGGGFLGGPLSHALALAADFRCDFLGRSSRSPTTAEDS